MLRLPILTTLVFMTAIPASADDWHGAQWITCDRPLDTPAHALAQRMGEWISGPAGTPVSGYRASLDLPDTPITRAMAWWGTHSPTNATIVVNEDTRFFANLIKRPKRELDLAFHLKPGKNTVEIRLEKPQPSPAATFGMRIQFADGTERDFQSSTQWFAITADGKSSPTTSKGRYSEAGLPPAVAYPHNNLAPAWFRTAVKVRPGLKSATLRHCGLGYGDPFINGIPVSDRFLSPPQTDYEAFAMFDTDDVTALLREGDNALSILLASGWFHQVGGFSSTFSYGHPRLRAVLTLNYEDGSSEQVLSGPSWQWKEGEIVQSNIYNGDVIDYRRAHDEWKKPSTGDGWKAAQTIESPSKKLLPVDLQPIRRIREISPTSITQVGTTTWLVDFGENISGWLKLPISEREGREIFIRYSEMARDGKIWNTPESHWWCHGEPQRDLIIAGPSPVVHEGRFSYKGFRWAEISGLSKAPDPESLRLVVVHNDCEVVANFDSSDPLLNRFWSMGINTHFSNMHSILEDCPHREKCQWGGDLHGSWAMGFHAFDTKDFYRQQVRIYYTGPMAEGGIPGLTGVGKRLANVQGDFNWGVSPLFLTWRLWTQFGDLDTAREFHPQMRHYLEFFDKQDPSGFPSMHRHADHAAPEGEIPRFPQDKALISAINYFAAAERFAEMSEALEKPEDAAWGRGLAKKIRAAVLTRFNQETHTFGNGTHDSLALAKGIFSNDPATEKMLAASMVSHYRKNGHKFDGGFLTYWLYPMLSRHGYADDALKMLRNPDYPGPAWSVKTWDATTFWEKFFTDTPTQFERSLNHHATNHPAAWLLTDLAGIQIDMDQSGGKNLLLAPHFPAGLDRVSGSMKIQTGGKLTSSWKRDCDTIEWIAEVPAGAAVKTRLVGWSPVTGTLPDTIPTGSHRWLLRPN